ncbi:MAG: PAS-domain containing protein [Dongiaceae bacterium]
MGSCLILRRLRWALTSAVGVAPMMAMSAHAQSAAPAATHPGAFWPFIVILAVVLLAVIGWLAWRYRRADEERSRLASDNAVMTAALGAANDGVLLWRRDQETTEIPIGIAGLLGLNGRARREDLVAALAPTDRDGFAAALQRLSETGTGFDITCRLAAGQRSLLVSGARIALPGGQADRLSFRDVSRLVDAAAAAWRGGERLAQILDSLPVPVWARNADLGLDYANAAYGRAVDAAPETAIEQDVELVGGPDQKARRTIAQRAFDLHAPHGEQKHVVIAGERRLLDITEQPLPSGGLVGRAMDQTALEDSRGELARHIRAHGEVLENLATSIVIFGSDGRLKFFNSEYMKQFDLEEEFLRTEPTLGEVLEVLRERRRIPEHADFPRYKRELVRELMSLITPREELLHLPDGSTIRMVAAAHPFGGVIVTYEDVTDTLRLERSYNTLIEVQRETLDHLYEGIAVFGSDGRLKLSNPAFARIWGLKPADVQSETHVAAVVDKIEAFFANHSHWPRLRQRIISRVADREPRNGKLERADGTVLVFASLPLPDGGCLYTYQDVTDSTRVERALRERNAALETADRLKSEFIANVSYELRTPLNAIIGFAEMLGNAYFGQLNERQSEYSRGIIEASHRLLALINDILDIATIEAGYLPLDIHPVDVRAMLAGVEALAAERARNRDLVLVTNCAADIGTVLGDERRLKQAIYNLVSNSLKFTPPGGRIEIAARRLAKEIEVVVSDTGVGIAPQDQTAVFEKFARVGGHGRHGGAGLGLALVKKLIELHNGRVELQSTPGKGTRVTCHIPIDESLQKIAAS